MADNGLYSKKSWNKKQLIDACRNANLESDVLANFVLKSKKIQKPDYLKKKANYRHSMMIDMHQIIEEDHARLVISKQRDYEKFDQYDLSNFINEPAHGKLCIYCGETGNRDSDEIVPVTKRGRINSCNQVTCCGKCNSSKGARSGDDFIRWLETSKLQDGSLRVKPERAQQIIRFVQTPSVYQLLVWPDDSRYRRNLQFIKEYEEVNERDYYKLLAKYLARAAADEDGTELDLQMRFAAYNAAHPSIGVTTTIDQFASIEAWCSSIRPRVSRVDQRPEEVQVTVPIITE